MNREIINWLESPEGEEWSRDRHGVHNRYRGALVSVIEDLPFHEPVGSSGAAHCSVTAVLWYQNESFSPAH